MAAHVRPRTRAAYTHTGFSGPAADRADRARQAEARRRLVPLAGYHLPRGFADHAPLARLSLATRLGRASVGPRVDLVRSPRLSNCAS